MGVSVLLSLLLLAFQAPEPADRKPEGNPIELRNNGFCAGISWVILVPGETVTMDDGPDFNVYRVRGPGGREWGVYSGFAGQSAPGQALLTKDGTTVYRGTERDEGGKRVFDGYYVGRKGGQNHFFGNVFRDDSADADFFKRVRLGKAADKLCAEDRK
ncbi:MAG: hypothetical protein JWO81_2695 [Alphaproteobacteria bacterium]|nr:hypothetical protein [Alphaproteobacteria bacterium]